MFHGSQLESECYLRLLASVDAGDHWTLFVDVGGDGRADGIAVIRQRLLTIAASGNDLHLSLVGVEQADAALPALLRELRAAARRRGRQVVVVAASAAVTGAVRTDERARTLDLRRVGPRVPALAGPSESPDAAGRPALAGSAA